MNKPATTSSAPSRRSGIRGRGLFQRQSTLNVIYFIDAKKSHTMRIPVRKAYWAMGLGSLLIFWCVVSAGLVIYNQNQKDLANQRVRHLLSTIYEFQVENEGVFEKAYPNTEDDYYYNAVAAAGIKLNEPAEAKPSRAAADEPDLDQEALQLAAKNLTSLKPEPDAPVNMRVADKATNTPVDAPQKQVPKPAVSDEASRSAATTAELKSSDKPFDFAIERLRANTTTQGMEVRFTLRNNNDAGSTEGFVYGIAQYQKDDQGSRYIAAPGSVGVNPDGKALNAKGAYLFRIRFRKEKTFSFSRPLNMPGAFKNVRIYVTDGKGANEKFYDLAVTDKFAKAATPPAPAETNIEPKSEVDSASPGPGEDLLPSEPVGH